MTKINIDILVGFSAQYKKGNRGKYESVNIASTLLSSNIPVFDGFKTNEYRIAFLLLYWRAGGVNRVEAIKVYHKLSLSNNPAFSYISETVKKLLPGFSYQVVVEYIAKSISLETPKSTLFLSKLLQEVYGIADIPGYMIKII